MIRFRDMPRTLRRRAIDAFRIAAMCFAVMLRPLNELGLVGDAF